MALQELDKHQSEAAEPCVGPLADVPTLAASRKKRAQGDSAWRKTVTQHAPEPWLAARLTLQARISALDVEV
jgi:hypothetical protein